MKQPKVEIYTTEFCHYCRQAKQLLDRKKIQYKEIKVDLDPEKRIEMEKRTGRHTVPQILIDGKLIGGFDDLWASDQSGQLDKLIRGE